MGGTAAFLVVDDEHLVRRGLVSVLEKHGTCSEAGSVAVAKEQLLRRSWDGIVLDVRLGDGSGLDLLADVRDRQVSVPAVVLSGGLDHDIINRADNRALIAEWAGVRRRPRDARSLMDRRASVTNSGTSSLAISFFCARRSPGGVTLAPHTQLTGQLPGGDARVRISRRSFVASSLPSSGPRPELEVVGRASACSSRT